MPDHHLTDELLVDDAAGALSEAVSLVVATHLSMCPDCRAEHARLELLAGVILEQGRRAPVDAGLFEKMNAKLETGAVEAPSRAPNAGGASLPYPLSVHVSDDLEELSWRRLIPGIYACDLAVGRARVGTSLLRLTGGSVVPEHGHGGLEVTLVLRGQLRDERALLRPGDVSICDEAVTHQPEAQQGEDCICLMVSEAPPQFTGPLGRSINPFLRI